MNTAKILQTIDTVKKEKVSPKFRLTPGRLNETMEFLGLPYKVESHMVGKTRIYEIKNKNGETLSFNSMAELIFKTPIKQAIENRSEEKLSTTDNFFKDINNSLSIEQRVKRGRKTKK